MTREQRPAGEVLPAMLFREALLDVATSPARALLLGIIATAVLTSIGLGELQTTARVLSDEEGFIAEGGFTVVASNEQQSIDAEVCLQAGSSPGVLGVAAIGHPETAVVGSAPNARFFEVPIGHEALAVIAPRFVDGNEGGVGDGWVVGGAAATELGVQVGDYLTANGRTRRVAVVVPEDAFRLDSLSRSLMTVGSLDESIERCVLDLDRTTFEATHQALSAMFTRAGPDVIVGRFHNRDALVLPPAEAVAQRPTRYTGVTGAIVLGVVGALSVWSRRSDVAVRRSVGMTPWAITGILVLDHAIIAWPAITIAGSTTVAVGALTQPWLPADQASIVLRSIAIAAVGSLVAVGAVAVLTAYKSSAATLKDR